LDYTYDLGDDWQHRIDVEDVLPADPNQMYPACTDGRGLAPEEDTGEVRSGKFDKAALNTRLLYDADAVAGGSLAVSPAGPVSDPVFTDLFPGLTVELAALCTCGEDHGEEGAPVLRPYQPVADTVLARLAAGSPLVEQAVGLARWVGRNRALTPSRLLRPADALAVAAELGLADLPTGSKKKLRSAKDLPELHTLWSAAVEAGLIDIHGTQASVGEGLQLWTTPDAETVFSPQKAQERLDNWARLLAGFLRARDDGDEGFSLIPTDELMPASIQMFYSLARSPLPAALPALVLVASIDVPNPVQSLWMFSSLPASFVAIAQDWVRVGVLATVDSSHPEVRAGGGSMAALTNELLDGPLAAERPAQLLLGPLLDAVRESPAVQLTALGSYGLRRLLVAHGWLVPEIGECANLDADLLLDRLDAYPPEDAIAEAEIWIAARGAQWKTALEDVAESARTKDLRQGPGRRAVLTGVLHAAGPRVAPVLATLADDPWLAAVAANARQGLGIGPELTLAEELWLAIDDLSRALEAEDDEIEHVLESSDLLELLGRPGALPAALASSHPYTRETLRLAGELSSDPLITRNLVRALDPKPSRQSGKTRQSRKTRRRK
jgi:hypothetical protein